MKVLYAVLGTILIQLFIWLCYLDKNIQMILLSKWIKQLSAVIYLDTFNNLFVSVHQISQHDTLQVIFYVIGLKIRVWNM